MMAVKKKLFTPWSSLDNMLGKPPTWWPEEERVRVQAYEKYDQMYWNDPTQYAVRVLEDEQPLYIPNARIIVDTTCQWLMKGLRLHSHEGDPHDPKNPSQKKLDDLLLHQRFYSKFNLNKSAGVTRGDSAWHVVADPDKAEGSRINIDTLHPGMAYRVFSDDDPDVLIKVHIVKIFKVDVDGQEKERINKLTYHKLTKGHPDYDGGPTLIAREQAIYEIEPEWWGPHPKKVGDVLPFEVLDSRITEIPVYWMPNMEWESQDYGSSELRGLEYLDWAASQGTTDLEMTLGLEGLGVYATDGGRPVDDKGDETDWEVSPGKVMEVPSGSYFRRVEGVGSITPGLDFIRYLEGKAYAASGLTDVALGQVDVQVAQSGIALAIKFMPTLAKVEQRDVAHIELLQKMWHDLAFWFEVYDPSANPGEVHIHIDKDKLPKDRVATLNELNNMLDRKIISRQYYRDQVTIQLGYNIPDNMDEEILKEAEAEAKIKALAAPPGLQQNAEDAAAGKKVITNANGGNNQAVDNSGNQSNNGSRPNESSGTEA
jgi:hypothetical protein